MMYLVSTFAAGAAAVELRGLAVDHTNDKIEFNGHGFANGQILKPSAAVAGLSADKLYVVDAATTNDFKLKKFKVADASGDSAQALSAAASGAQTLAAYGSKKCNIASATASDDKVTCAAATTFAITDELLFYCDAGDKDVAACKVDGAGNADLASGKSVWAREANAKSFELAKAAPTGSTPAAKVAIGQNNDAAAPNKVWLLSKDTASIYAVAPKTLIADGGKWDLTANEGVCGNAACGITNNTFYYYTAGTVATAGLTTGNVYHAQVATATPWKFELNAVTAGTAVTKKDDVNVVVTSSGNGDSYQKVSDGRRITGSTASDNTITILGDNDTGPSKYAADTLMMFWCSDTTTAADCQYNVTGMANGSTFKVKAVTDNGTTDTKASLKAATGSDATAIAVTTNATGKTKGYALKKDSSAAVIFPAAAAGAGSAARSFAMLGSAVAMATAFLLA